MASSDESDNEEEMTRRRVRRKSTSAAKLALDLGAPFSMLQERKSLSGATSVEDEHDRRTTELIKMLRSVPAQSEPQPSTSGFDRSTAHLDIPQNHVQMEMRKSIPKVNAHWLLAKIQEKPKSSHEIELFGNNNDMDKYWVTDYMKELPDKAKESYDIANVPRQILSAATDARYDCAYQMSCLNIVLMETSWNLHKWLTMVDLTKTRKLELLLSRIAIREKLSLEPKTLDEESIWGLKPLRFYFSAPYLKTADGLSASPAHPVLEIWRSKYKDVPVDFNGKQNWMAKDTAALKDSIRDFLVERKLFRINVRAELLMSDCVRAHQNQLEERRMRSLAGLEEEDEGAEPAPKRRGRPSRKSGRQKVFATITPTLFTLPNGIVVRYFTTNADIQEWKDKSSDAVRKLKYVPLVEELRGEIDWDAISNKVTAKTKKNRSARDCYLAFKHEVDPNINSKRWSQQEVKKLMGNVQKHGIKDIEKIVDLIGNNRTDFQCFQRWKNMTVKSILMNWDAEKDRKLNELIQMTAGNWKQVAFKLEDDLATKNRVMDRFKKNTNPMLKAGQFTRVEDALLILTIEKLKAHIAREGHFGELIAYLPWRFKTVWRDRAGNLFANFIVPWTLEEDKQLLDLAETMNRDWRKISDTFKSFKNRKGCLTRWKILQKRVNNFGSLEAYHESYSMTRYNIFQYKHLNDILDLLTKVMAYPTLPNVHLSPRKPPTDDELTRMLLAFNRNIMGSAISSLARYVEQRDDTWKHVVQKVNERQKTFDRRTFHRDLAQSMASAIHIRGLHLVPRENIAFELTDYQEDVYKYYARFTRTKSLKQDAKRPYIPTAYELCEMPEVQDIIQPMDDADSEILIVKEHRPRRSTKRGTKAAAEKQAKKMKVELVEMEDEEGEFSEPECVTIEDDIE